MAGIKDLIKVYRGDSRSFDGKKFESINNAKKVMNEGLLKNNDPKRTRTSGRWYTTEKDYAKNYSNLKKTGMAGLRKLKEATISKADFIKGNNLLFKALSGDTLKKTKELASVRNRKILLLPKKNLKDVKVLESTLYNKDGLDTKKGKVKLTSENLKRNLLKTLQSNVKAYTPLAIKGLNKLASAPAAFILTLINPTEMGNAEINNKLENYSNLKKFSNIDKAIETEQKDI